MALRWISSAWQANLKSGFPQDHRLYVDFRQRQYPDVGAGAPIFTLVDSADNQPGSHYLSGGFGTYLLPLQNKYTVEIYFYSNFAYTAAQQNIWGWYPDGTHALYLIYDTATDKFLLSWNDGGTGRAMYSRQFDDGTSYENISQWMRITACVDLTSTATTGSALYFNGTADDTTWSGLKPIFASNFPLARIRSIVGTTDIADIKVGYVRMFPGICATAADVANNFKDLKDEEVVWHFNGHPTGHTRCNISPRMNSLNLQRTIESPVGRANPNQCMITLMSPAGEFADDQYAAFTPASEWYNGTIAQKYMQSRCGIEVETWYGNTYELEFTGRVDNSMFKRRSGVGLLSTVFLQCYDPVEDMRCKVKDYGTALENYELSNTTTTGTSILHTMLAYASQVDVKNYLANSSFENTTVGNSWAIIGASATITRAAGGLLGSYQGDIGISSATDIAYLQQTVTFRATKKCNAGQNWNYSCYLKSATSLTPTVQIDGRASGGTTLESAVDTTPITGGAGWAKREVTLSLTTALTDTLVMTVACASSGTLSVDCAMLIQNKTAVDWFVLNDNDGASTVESADDADSDQYDTVGIDVDSVMTVHPWARVEDRAPLWPQIADIADATAARYLGCDPCGTLRFRSPFKPSYADPSSLMTITDVQAIESVIEPRGANRIAIHGDRIVKASRPTCVWEGLSAKLSPSGADLNTVVAAGETYPFPSIWGEYWADFQED